MKSVINVKKRERKVIERRSVFEEDKEGENIVFEKEESPSQEWIISSPQQEDKEREDKDGEDKNREGKEREAKKMVFSSHSMPKAASLAKLVQLATDAFFLKTFPNFAKNFVISFVSICKPLEIFTLLVYRYEGPELFNNSLVLEKFSVEISSIQSLVSFFFLNWYFFHPQHFLSLKQHLLDFSSSSSSPLSSLLLHLSSTLEKGEEVNNQKEKQTQKSLLESLFGGKKEGNVLELQARDIARALNKLEYLQQKRIPTSEFVEGKWEDDNKHKKEPNYSKKAPCISNYGHPLPLLLICFHFFFSV